MTERKRRWLLAVWLLLFAGRSGAVVTLPRLLSDGMVLQRDAPLRLWGRADRGERVRITFRGQSTATRVDSDGRWFCNLPPQPAGGPYEMTFKAGNTLTIRDVYVGDVWLASGQSNMEFPLQAHGGFGGVVDAAGEVAAANYPRIRLFAVGRETALAPRTDVRSDGWRAAAPATVSDFSAVAYLFGRELYRRYGVAVGLIESDWGGTPAEVWTSAAGLSGFPEFERAISDLSRFDARAVAEFRSYAAVKNRWYALHGRQDRGRVDGRDIWSAPEFDASDWPQLQVPQHWPGKAAKDFDGTMWYRKEFDLPPAQDQVDGRLHLSKMLQADTTYFNGEIVGETTGDARDRDYLVPARHLRPGRNVIVVRLVGQYRDGDGYVGMNGVADDMYLQVGGTRVALAGTWRFQTGADLTGLPEVPPYAMVESRFPQMPSVLFNGMIAPLTGYRLKGVIWYQGESNVGRAAQYRSLFPALIRDWRRQWGYEMPFLFVQLAGFGSDSREPAESARAELREAQGMALALPGTGMVTAIDVGDAADIHPRNKQEVAHRLALAAAGVAYHDGAVASGPTYRSMRVDGDEIRITFSGAGGGLRVMGNGGALRGFAIASDPGKFIWADARLEGEEAVVSGAGIRHPAAVRYDWSNTPDGNLYDAEGLPAPPFRTDSPLY